MQMFSKIKERKLGGTHSSFICYNNIVLCASILTPNATSCHGHFEIKIEHRKCDLLFKMADICILRQSVDPVSKQLSHTLSHYASHTHVRNALTNIPRYSIQYTPTLCCVICVTFTTIMHHQALIIGQYFTDIWSLYSKLDYASLNKERKQLKK